MQIRIKTEQFGEIVGRNRADLDYEETREKIKKLMTPDLAKRLPPGFELATESGVVYVPRAVLDTSVIFIDR